MTHDTIKQEVREEFRTKFGQFYVSVDAQTRAIRIVDIENGVAVRGDDGTDIECIASGDIEKYLVALIDRVREATIQECVEALNDGLVVIDQKTVERFAHQLSMLPDGDFLKSDGAYFLRTAQLLTRERDEAAEALLALKSNEV